MDCSLRYPGRWFLNTSSKSQLELYRRRTEELEEFRLPGYPAELTIELHANECRVEAELPDETTLRSAAMAVRYFFLDKEPTYFFRVCSILWQAAQEQRFKRANAQIRAACKQLLDQPLSLSTSIAGERVNTRMRVPANLDTRSEGIWTGIPAESGQPIRRKLDSDSGGI